MGRRGIRVAGTIPLVFALACACGLLCCTAAGSADLPAYVQDSPQGKCNTVFEHACWMVRDTGGRQELRGSRTTDQKRSEAAVSDLFIVGYFKGALKPERYGSALVQTPSSAEPAIPTSPRAPPLS